MEDNNVQVGQQPQISQRELQGVQRLAALALEVADARIERDQTAAQRDQALARAKEAEEALDAALLQQQAADEPSKEPVTSKARPARRRPTTR